MNEINIQGILLRKITVGSFDNNVYLFVDPITHESLIIDAAAEADRILKASGVTQGYCLVLGLGTGGLAKALALQSKLRVIAIDPDAGKGCAARSAH